MHDQHNNPVLENGKQQYIMYYKCLETGTLRTGNVVSTQPYMKIVMQFYVCTPEWFKTDTKPPGSRVYKLVETGERLPSVVSTAFYYQHTNGVSADHCEDKHSGKGIATYALAEVVDERGIFDDKHTAAEYTKSLFDDDDNDDDLE